MGLSAYRVSYERLDRDFTEQEVDFLLSFYLENATEARLYLDEEILDGEIEAWQQQGKEPSKELVEWLRKQIKEDGFEFVIE